MKTDSDLTKELSSWKGWNSNFTEFSPTLFGNSSLFYSLHQFGGKNSNIQYDEDLTRTEGRELRFPKHSPTIRAYRGVSVTSSFFFLLRHVFLCGSFKKKSFCWPPYTDLSLSLSTLSWLLLFSSFFAVLASTKKHCSLFWAEKRALKSFCRPTQFQSILLDDSWRCWTYRLCYYVLACVQVHWPKMPQLNWVT